MKIDVLSDHPGAVLRETERALQQAKVDEAGRRRDLYEAEAELAVARRGRSWRRRLLRLPTAEEHVARAELEEAQRLVADADAEREELFHRTEQQRAGVDGEQRVVRHLADHLSDDWRLLRGYHNGQGETDMLLIGPRGVWAVEVKAYRARLHVDGKHWWYLRPGLADGPIEATDGNGRTWGEQVSQVAAGLATWLGDQQHPLVVRRAVVLVNDRASIEVCRNSGVDLVSCDLAELVDAINGQAAFLRADQRKAIRHLIRRDHRFHLQRRLGREASRTASEGPEGDEADGAPPITAPQVR